MGLGALLWEELDALAEVELEVLDALPWEEMDVPL